MSIALLENKDSVSLKIQNSDICNLDRGDNHLILQI